MKSGSKQLSVKAQQAIIAYLFLLPAVAVFVTFTVIPFFTALYAGFTDYNMVNRMDFLGLENYIYIMTNGYFLRSLLNVLLFAVMYVPLVLVLSFFAAVLLNQNLPGAKVFRAFMYFPCLTNGVATAYVWMWIFNPTYGLLNQLLGVFGLPPGTWLTDPSTAMVSIVIICVWSGIGGNMLIFVAALQGIPNDLYEAAELDGANCVQRFFRITVPMMVNSVQFVVTQLIIGAFQLFDVVYLITQGGPMGSTMTPVVYIYLNAFNEYKGGIACAMSTVLMIVILAVSIVTRRFIREEAA